MPLTVLVAAPHFSEEGRGNGVTVRRIAGTLGNRGVLFRVEPLPEGDVHAAAARLRPDLIHAFHAREGGGAARDAALRLGIPLVVTMTGTDMYDPGDVVPEVLRDAAAVTVFSAVMAARVSQAFGVEEERLHVVPQGVAAPPEPPPPPEMPMRFLLPAGLRPVKNVLYALPLLGRLRQEFPRVSLLLAGPVIDAAYAAGVTAEAAASGFASCAGELTRGGMERALAECGVVLNTSRTEGGMPNSLLEAMAAARPVLAADIEGNRGIVADGENGFLYASEEEFLAKGRRLLQNPGLARRMGLAGWRCVREKLSPEREAAGYLRIYEKVSGRG